MTHKRLALGFLGLALALPIPAADGVQPRRLRWRNIGPVFNGQILQTVNVAAISVDPTAPSTLYVGSSVVLNMFGTTGIAYKSIDGGDSWVAMTKGFPFLPLFAGGAPPARAFAVDPSSPSSVYAGMADSGVFKSSDGGLNWGGFNRGLPNLAVLAIALGPSSGTLSIGTNLGVFRSTDGANSWQPTGALASPLVLSLVQDPADPMTLYAGTSGGGVYKTTNGGSSWLQASNGLSEPDVHALASTPGSAVLYAGTNGGQVFRTQDGGASWTGSFLGVAFNVVALAIDPARPTVVYAGTQGAGVFQSDDAGSTWTPINVNLFDLQARSLAIAPTDPPRLYVGTPSGVFVLEESGQPIVPSRPTRRPIKLVPRPD